MLDANANVMNAVTAVVSIFTKDEEDVATILDTTVKGSAIGTFVGGCIGAFKVHKAHKAQG